MSAPAPQRADRRAGSALRQRACNASDGTSPETRSKRQRAVLALAAGLVAACAARPVVYPSAGTQQVGPAQTERDVEDCTALARAHAREDQALARDATRSTVAGGAVGAATGGVGGAIWGHPGRGAATGAAVGATRGLLGAILRRAPGEDPVQRRYVERCLAERGYQVLGWR